MRYPAEFGVKLGGVTPRSSHVVHRVNGVETEQT